ncbi:MULTISPECIES: disulfide oxidoreductase [Paenibacillus]|jgi:disulfide bond formation protein DsbB|uniref:Disulfide bond formation protein C n=1 Tax=Paenibacillus azoreducens TaxID=116718 RepID=A0A920CU51_9BACL|nr:MULTISPECIES: disulfide oxidoreductase [Paenibacillus]MBE9916294.1 disulfide bond formation protein B [Paenibacillus donghaensis]GIO49929.1 disulfide bond formation protein C [Paenibacillus azoreducens]
MESNRFLASIRPYALYLAWIVSIVATGASLYLSEVLHYLPCNLCWFQRIFMYPQVILLGIASYKNDRKIIPYAVTLSVIGGCISIYHYAEQKIPALAKALPCTAGIPCNFDYLNWFGFITIPLMALIASILIIVLLLAGRETKEEVHEA